jgi:hypothetical protein
LTTVALLPLLQAAGQNTLTRITTEPFDEASGYSNRGVWVDYDDDGDLDLFVANGWPDSGGLDRALARLREEYAVEGRGATYEVLRTFEPGEQSPLSYAEAAGRLGVSESAVKSMIYRLRQRHRELLREEVAHTVPSVAEIDEELRHLVSVLRG